jgi:hypothetical protein
MDGGAGRSSTQRRSFTTRAAASVSSRDRGAPAQEWTAVYAAAVARPSGPSAA